MKKLLALAAFAFCLTSCGDSSADADGDSAATDTVAAPAETAPMSADTAAAAATIKDGVMTLKDGKVLVMVAGAWEPLKAAVTTTNGRKVDTDGTVSKGDKKRKLEEGMMIDKDGQMMDKDGKMLDNTGWE